MKKNLIPVTLLALSAIQAVPAFANSVACQALSAATPTVALSEQTPTDLGRATDEQFDALYARCSTYVSDLQTARWNAQMEATVGAFDRAIQILITELREKAREIGSDRQVTPPHAMDAILVGLNVVETTLASANQERLSKRLLDQVKYIALDSVYDLIESAYFNLDERFYFNVVGVCNRPGIGCYGNNPRFVDLLPFDYFDGVRQLSLQFLDLQVRLAEVQASDNIELNTSRAVVAGAKGILNTSVYRRALSCAITRLDQIERQIEQFLECGSVVSKREQVAVTRRLLNEARNLVIRSAPNQGCRR